MVNPKLRAHLDGLGEQELLRLRESVEDSPDGSKHEVEGIEVSKDSLLMLINQALPVADS